MLRTVKRYLKYGRTACLYVYLQLFQAINKTIIGTGRRQYEIRYILHDRMYRIRTRVKRGPPVLLAAHDQFMNDITDHLFSYLGPNHDFHGHPLSPHELGYEKIHLRMRSGKEIWIEGDCKIHLDEIVH